MSSPLVIAGGGKVGVPGASGSRLVSVLGSQRAEEIDEKACRQRGGAENELSVGREAQGDRIWRQAAKIDCSLRGSFFKVPAFYTAQAVLQSSCSGTESHNQEGEVTPRTYPTFQTAQCPHLPVVGATLLRLPRCIKCSTAAGIRLTLRGIASMHMHIGL